MTHPSEENREIFQSEHISGDVEQGATINAQTGLFKGKILKAMSLAGIVGALTACTNQVGDEEIQESNVVNPSSNTTKAYPEIRVSYDNDQSISTFSMSLWRAEQNYTFTVTPHDHPEDAFEFTTDIRDDGWYGKQHKFNQPVSGFDVSAVLNEGTATVLITNPCEGERDTCIKGFQSYP